MSIVRARDISKSFTGVQALKAVSFELLAGEVPVGAQGPIEHPLRGAARENVHEGLGDDGGQTIERRPGKRPKPGERIKTGC